jgi:exonuclease III
MKIASFNINNINRRLPNLLHWLASGELFLLGEENIRRLSLSVVR